MASLIPKTLHSKASHRANHECHRLDETATESDGFSIVIQAAFLITVFSLAHVKIRALKAQVLMSYCQSTLSTAHWILSTHKSGEKSRKSVPGEECQTNVMSLEQSLTKLNLSGDTRKAASTLSASASSLSTPQQQSQSASPSTSTSPKPTLNKATSFTFAKRDKSPLRQAQVQLERVDSVDVDNNSTTSSGGGSNKFINSHSSPPPTHTVSVDRTQSVRLTRKILHNWKSACGSKTKDLFRRWKTLPEDHPDFDSIPGGPNYNTAGGSISETTSRGSKSNIPGSVAVSSGGSSAQHGGSPLRKAKKLSDFSALNAITSSFDDGGRNNGGGGGGMNGKAGGWSVHVWTTYVRRGSGEAEDGLSGEGEAPPPRDVLSEFQKVKLTYFFRQVLDANKDDLISASDFMALNQRIRHYVEWSNDCIEFHILKEVHSGFLECFLNQPLDESSHMYYISSEKETRDFANIEQWLDIWGELLGKSRDLEALPLWLQYFPKILFQVINKTGSGVISREQLRAFYTMFLGIDFRVVNETLDSIYEAMTDKNRSKLDYATFRLCFANFLFGRYPHGPGQYLFGICSPQTLQCPFPIDYSALNTPATDLEPYDPDRDKSQCNRRSVIV